MTLVEKNSSLSPTLNAGVLVRSLLIRVPQHSRADVLSIGRVQM